MEAVKIEQKSFIYNPISLVEVVLLADKMKKGMLEVYPQSVYNTIIGFDYEPYDIPEDPEVQEDRGIFELCQQAYIYQEGGNLSSDAEWRIVSTYLKGLATISGHKPELFLWNKEDYFTTKESMRLLMKEDILFKPIRRGPSVINVGLYYGSPRYLMIMRRLGNMLFNGIIALARPANGLTYVVLCGRKRESISKEQLEKAFNIKNIVII